MKKVGLLLVGLTLILGGCAKAPPSTQSSEQSDSNTESNPPISDAIVWKSVNNASSTNIAIAKDTETGCEYIELDNQTVTPRLNSSGQPMCGL